MERDLANLGQKVAKHVCTISRLAETSKKLKYLERLHPVDHGNFPKECSVDAETCSPRAHGDMVRLGTCGLDGQFTTLTFGSMTDLKSQTVTFAIHDLCLHPEYVEPLRTECNAQYADFERTGTGLPLLDSFVKESARLTPVESCDYPLCPTLAGLTKFSKHSTIRFTALYAGRRLARRGWRLVLHTCAGYHDERGELSRGSSVQWLPLRRSKLGEGRKRRQS
jgi:hypothetical protein